MPSSHEDSIETARVVERPATSSAPCRCGRRLTAGTVCVGFDVPPDPIGYLLKKENFCSLECARAYLLETAEVLDATAAGRTLTDYDALYFALRSLLTVVDRQRSLRRVA
jgi:hypothetical protein